MTLADSDQCSSFYSSGGTVRSFIGKLNEDVKQIDASMEALYAKINAQIVIDPNLKDLLPLIKLDRETEQQLMKIQFVSTMEGALAKLGLLPNAGMILTRLATEAVYLIRNPVKYDGSVTTSGQYPSLKYLIYTYALDPHLRTPDYMEYTVYKDMFTDLENLAIKANEVRDQLSMMTRILKLSEISELGELKKIQQSNLQSELALQEHFDSSRIKAAARWLFEVLKQTDSSDQISIAQMAARADSPEIFKVLLENSRGLDSFFILKKNINVRDFNLYSIEGAISNAILSALRERNLLSNILVRSERYLFPKK